MGTYSWDLLDALLYASPNTRQLYAYYYVNVGLYMYNGKYASNSNEHHKVY